MHDEHLRLGAKMTQFAGWELPLYYSSIVREVQATRAAAGVFDLSHMGEIWIEDTYALESLQRVTTNDAAALQLGRAQYTLMCNESAGVLDDLIVYRVATDSYMLVTNAANKDSDREWVEYHKHAETSLEDRSGETGLIAVQGPCAAQIMQELGSNAASLRRFCGKTDEVGAVKCWIARTGYTGEDGFELYAPTGGVVELWSAVLGAAARFGGVPVGLGARDILRLEAGYMLYGCELTPSITPVDAGLLWIVKFEKGDFIGKEAIVAAKATGPRQTLVALEALEACVPRHGHSVSVGRTTVGRVTSGTFSPTLRRPIAMGYVKPEWSGLGTEVDVHVRAQRCRCRIVEKPFYRRH